MPQFNMSEYFDIRIRFDYIGNTFCLDALNASANFVLLLNFEDKKTYKLKIYPSGGNNFLEIVEEVLNPSTGFVDYLSSSSVFSCYFFQEFVGSAIAGIIGIGDVRPVSSKPLRLTKLDDNFIAYIKIEFEKGILKCLIKDTANTVNTLSSFKNANNQTFYKILT
ncbi:MAG: hypothetical protein GC205_10885 [Bacteroidetes bacterium]|nr:hypothetical protein [Bacteroidota bacterium]